MTFLVCKVSYPTVYGLSFGDDRRNFLGVAPVVGRNNFQRINAVIEKIASWDGQIVYLHAHFLTSDPSWFTETIELSLRGVSEVCRVFLPYVLARRNIHCHRYSVLKKFFAKVVLFYKMPCSPSADKFFA